MIINHINDLLPAIEGRKEFVVIEKPGYTVIDYVYMDKDTFDDPRLLECRGIKFDPDGIILARPFKKFFNVGEREQAHEIDVSKPHVITEKLDGSMIHPAIVDGELVLMTRKGITDVAEKAAAHFLDRPEYRELMLMYLTDNVTPIFEYVGPDNRIVLHYDEPALILIAARHNVDGKLVPGWTTRASALARGIPHVGSPKYIEAVTGEAEDGMAVYSMSAFVDWVRELEDEEGYVIKFDDGHMIKMKADDYVLKHRVLSGMDSKKKVSILCATGLMDDVLPILRDSDAKELQSFNDDIHRAINRKVMQAEALAGVWDTRRKEFALEVMPRLNPPWLAAIVFAVMDGKDAREQIIKGIRRNYESLDVQWRGE